MATWILHCHLGRRRVELPDPPTPDSVRAALERVSPRPGWTDGATIEAFPDWNGALRILAQVKGQTIGLFKRSKSRSQNTRVSIYLSPNVYETLLIAADNKSVSVSEMGNRLVTFALKQGGLTIPEYDE